ncbi:MAG: ABC transporter permease subunit [Silvanigrellales bacterium]|nr:ABC transporter permease subunit [Silvanigrellales bacterium]
MPVLKVHTPKAVRLQEGAYWLADALIIGVVCVVGFGLLYFFDISNAPFVAEVPISTGLRELPGYALLSLTRSLIALAISYVFAILYGTIAARDPRYERVMIPMLDVLQSLPVLTFLPGLVLTLMHLFPGSRWGLEIACVLMIFTGQVWNLVFAYYESQRSMSPELQEFARLTRLTGRQRFLVLDLPNGIRPLVYNGMMSMAGGWFFLTLCEAFVLGKANYRLPGLGSYLGVTFEAGAYGSFAAGLAALFVIIVGVDFLLWKPLIAWVSQFRDVSEGEAGTMPRSLFLDLLKRTRLQRAVTDAINELVSFLAQRMERIAHKSRKPSGTSLVATPMGIVIRGKASLLGQARRNTRTMQTWIQWIVSFSIGAVVFYLLPKLPEIAAGLASVKSDDWLELTNALLMTALKVAGVLVIATLWTVPVGLWIGQRRRVATWAEPIIQNIAAFPAPVLYPLIVFSVAKFGMPAGVVAMLLMTIGNQWYMLFNVLSGASRISPDLKAVARIYRFSPWQKLTKFYIPAIFPSLVTGWISAAGGSWNASIVAEMVSYPGGSLRAPGIGGEISRATAEGNFPRLVAAVIVITIALVVINRSLWRTLHEHVEKVK